MPGEAELVMFAIRSAIRLGQQTREAYVASTQGRELTLPLPNYNPSRSVADAVAYFDGPGREHVQESARLSRLLEKRHGGAQLSPDEGTELMAFHDDYLLLDLTRANLIEPTKDGTLFTATELNALITIRQWRPGTDPNPSVLKRFAGTFIELGIDYFVNVPGALNTESRHGRAVHAFLSGLESFDFPAEPLGNLPGRLFMAAVETVGDHSELLTGDVKVQELLRVITEALTKDVAARIQSIRAGGGSDSVLEGRVAEWAELVFRSLLASGGPVVLADPKGFLGVKTAGESALVAHVGQAVLSLVLDQPEGRLDRVFGREGIESVLKAALTAVGKHPEILVRTNNAGLQKLLGEIAMQLGEYETLLSPSLLPQVTRLILEKTGDNLELLWPEMETDPRRHLLLTTAKTALSVLTKPPAPGDRWKPAFRRDNLVALSETVFDELIQNPGWLVQSAGKTNESLGLALEAGIAVLRARGDQRLSTKTGLEVLRAAIQAVALRSEFLDRLPADVALAGKPVLAGALDAMLGTIFDPGLPANAGWRLGRADVVAGIVRIGLEELSRTGLTTKEIDRLRTFMAEQAALIASGSAWDLPSFASSLRTALTDRRPTRKRGRP